MLINGLRINTDGVVVRKQTYQQKETGQQRYVVEVAIVGATLPVFLSNLDEYEAAPGEDAQVSVAGRFSPGRDGTFRLEGKIAAVHPTRPKTSA